MVSDNSCTRERRPRVREFNGRGKRPRATEKNETVREKVTLTSAAVRSRGPREEGRSGDVNYSVKGFKLL